MIKKKWAKMLKVYRIKKTISANAPLKDYVLYTQFNINKYGGPPTTLLKCSLLHKNTPFNK